MQQTDFNQFSLLYPDGESRRAHFAGEDSPRVDEFTLSELGLDDILPLKNSRAIDFLTASPAVIRYRQQVFADLLAHEEIGKTLTKLIPVLFDILELRRLESDSGDTADYLSSMTEIELYTIQVTRHTKSTTSAASS